VWPKTSRAGLICRTRQHCRCDCQTPSGQISGGQSEQEIDDYGGKDFEKRKVLKHKSEKRHEKCQQAVQDQSVTMEKSWVMMMYQTDKEHEQ